MVAVVAVAVCGMCERGARGDESATSPGCGSCESLELVGWSLDRNTFGLAMEGVMSCAIANANASEVLAEPEDAATSRIVRGARAREGAHRSERWEAEREQGSMRVTDAMLTAYKT